jgi:hypothetical protein
MADNELRPEVLAGLTRARGLSTEQGDALLDATPAERDAASRILLEQTRDMLEQAGLLPAQRSILDIDLRRVTSLAAVYGIVSRWWDQPGYRERPLGDVLKVIPADLADQVHSFLVVGGWLVEIPLEGER